MSAFPKVLEETLTTTSTTSFFDKALCIIYQCPGGVLYRVEFKTAGHNMLDVSSRLPDKTFFRRLTSISTAEGTLANDVTYYNLCWGKAKKKAFPKQKPAENYIKTLSNVEILNHIENSLADSSIEFLDMNKLNEVYKKMLAENGQNHDNISPNYKKQLKELVEENLPEICFVPSNQKNKPEKLTTKLTQAEAWEVAIQISQEDKNRSFESLVIWRWFFNISHVLTVTYFYEVDSSLPNKRFRY